MSMMGTAAAAGGVRLTWDLGLDLRQLFAYHFMVDAFRAGTIVAVTAGLVGWFMVLRRQAFAGHTLALVGFPGAAGAIWIGLSATWGYLVFCVAAALVMSTSPPGRSGSGLSEESALVGTVQAFALACGFLFASLYQGFLGGITALLFGSVVGITDHQVVVLGVVAAGAVIVLGAISRPLFFASVDPEVAAARHVPVRLISALFLVLLGVAAAEISQITGSLLVFALLVMPAATAQSLTTRTGLGAGLAVAVALAVTWTGLALAYFSTWPVGFYITTLAFGAYVAAAAYRLAAGRGGRRRNAGLESTLA